MRPRERGLRWGEFCLCLTTDIADSVRLWGTAAGAQFLRLSTLSERFFILGCVIFMLSVCSVAWLFLLGCQYQCK